MGEKMIFDGGVGKELPAVHGVGDPVRDEFVHSVLPLQHQNIRPVARHRVFQQRLFENVIVLRQNGGRQLVRIARQDDSGGTAVKHGIETRFRRLSRLVHNGQSERSLKQNFSNDHYR